MEQEQLDHGVGYTFVSVLQLRICEYGGICRSLVSTRPIVPFLVEDELMRLGAIFEKKDDWQPLSIVDGRLITGQNPASSTVAAQNLVNLLAAEKAA